MNKSLVPHQEIIGQCNNLKGESS
jgi:hypothetical protein